MEPVYADADLERDQIYWGEGGVVLYLMVEPRPEDWNPGDIHTPGDPYDPLVYSIGFENPTNIPQVIRLYDNNGVEIWKKTLKPNFSELTYVIPAGRRPRRSSANISITADLFAPID
jgi:hypothetical protein